MTGRPESPEKSEVSINWEILDRALEEPRISGNERSRRRSPIVVRLGARQGGRGRQAPPRNSSSSGHNHGQAHGHFQTRGRDGHPLNRTVAIQGMRLNRLERSLKTTQFLYRDLLADLRKIKTQNLTLALMQKKLSDKLGHQVEKADMLELAKIYMGDKITDLKDQLEDVNKELETLKAKSKASRENNLTREEMTSKIRDAVLEVKSDISWGKFNGTCDELDEIFKKVLDILQ